ncbi:papilin isoform X1 [Dendroctonus ponderosae]|uniref:papilin isoform X1 n=1 Tax=Dendroctonus ponderosae TaxID=77166 RepID=UPI002035B11D|nr:papilin isoform X1 [Dendroctonus ponderosae]
MELTFRRRCRSPLLFAVIFVTFFHSALSRHRIRHYRDRFKRQQGAHLYLPESYVTEGGEGPDLGYWTEWSEPSPCSRTCGGGVSSQFRQCQEGNTCQGPNRRHFSCNTQDCPDTGDFRAQQCSEYDEVPFENVKYQWVPYTKGPNACELNCMPRGQRFYYRHAEQVVDGTRCNDESLDVCVNGQCQPVGCDMMLGSNLKEDECRICGGDGSTCNTVTNTLELNDMQVGYNDILLIPGGATNIVVEEVANSNNYLAVRNTSGHYYLNGNWRIDFPRALDFAGSKFHYERYPQGFAAPDKIYTLGPIDEPLFIVLLFQDSTVPVQYKYSLPTNIQPGSEYETYAWTFDEYTQCTVTCGGGIQHRNVSCAGRKTLEPVDETLCDASRKPETSRRCNEVACDAQWVPHPWGNCSVPCGEEGGVQTREISCQQIVSNGYPSLVDESQCQDPKPPQQQTCNKGVTCATWHSGPWSPCDHLCGDGKQIRQVRCFIRDADDKIQIMEDSTCEAIEDKPAEEQSCFSRPCEGVDWISSEWSGCDSVCGLTNETRKIFCATANGQIFEDDLCEESNKPESVRKCEANTNETCNFLWYASQWSECSARCGKGIQTRTLFCGLATGDEVKKVENDKCDQSKTFDIIRNCTGTEDCDGEWFSGPWGECSKPCGVGERTKKVVCIKANEVVDVSHCDADKIIFGQEDCNKQPCTEDSELPVDKDTPLKLQETTESESMDSAESTIATDKETEDTSSSSDISEITKSIDFTTEPQAEESSKEEEDDFEIVPADSCDDGEWVEISVMGVPEEEETEVSELVESTSAGTTDGLETSYSVYDVMQSDSPTRDETEFVESSAEGESGVTTTSSSIEPEEGSGASETPESTDSPTSPTMQESDATEPVSSTGSLSETTTDLIASSTASGSTEVSSDASSSSTESTGDDLSSTTSSEGTETTTEVDSSTLGESTSESASTETTADKSSTTESTVDSSSTTELSSTETISTEITEISTTSESVSTTETSEATSETSTTSAASSETSEASTGTESYSTETDEMGLKNEPDPDSTPPPRARVEDESETGSSSEATTEATEISSPATETSAEVSTTESLTGSTEEAFESVTSESTTISSTEQSSESSTTEVSGSSTEVSGSSTEVSGSSTEVSGSTTEVSASTTEVSGSTTEVSGSPEATTEYTGSTEFDIFSSTSEAPTWPTTHITELFKKKQKMCKRKKILQCKESAYGCCWDNIHAAQGPFDKGCPTPKTCKESTYGCCPDGVSAALGTKNRGCPSSHCNETLFGCCWDKKTPAEGNDEEGCPAKPPACLESKWGCCKDNSTEAEGPNQKGCEPEEVTTIQPTTVPSTTPSTEECKQSDHGCCPDGSMAKGPQYQGCKLPCSDSTYGCCPDQETPAHGYRGEGCCLTSTFGCCSDDLTPARGPNGDGCECQSSPYGCCPDQKTAAKGYNNAGCGCQYSEHGCCPDDVTEASAPDYEGCPCHTFQFGCCPDGVSIAQGPHQQGCDCRSSEFGCCSDERTAAKGPNEEGCTCDISKHGCCLDGVTKAQGSDFAGCEEIPVDQQASCSLPKERGTCRNYTVKWFFDMAYGGCSRFWYGGCDGNENRFKTKEECEGVCVKPLGIERCNLPKVNGSCEGYFLQWYYDKQAHQCSQFVYGGCLGNNNKFETREECAELCAKNEAADPCDQSKAEGPCRGQYRRYFFDKTSGQCQPFSYGGCRGNTNNFASLEACNQRCATPGKKRDYCTIPKAEGNCTAREAKWYYGANEERCLPFYYTGCNGNKNTFDTKDACLADCPNDIVKNTCHLPADIGECGNYVSRWYWDTRYKRCSQFYFGGCGGNGNNFQSEQECQQECAGSQQPPPLAVGGRQTEAPPTQVPLVTPQVPSPTSRQPTLEEICSREPDRGPCSNEELHYYYNTADGTCKNFTYGGCGGNYNNFETEDLCLQYCGSIRALPPAVQPAVTTQGPPSVPQIVVYGSECYEDQDAGNCTDQYQAYYHDRVTGECQPFIYTGCGGNENRFYSEEDCLRRCGPYNGQDTCNMESDPGPCKQAQTKYTFDRTTGSCRQFVYGGCEGNGNRFNSVEECERHCGRREEPKAVPTVAEVCQLAADQGSCPDLNHKRWYFDNTQGECKAFIYSGCGGNQNNFKTFQTCLDYCKDFLPNTESSVVEPGVGTHECQAKFDECTSLRCPYGIEAYVDENDCNGCRCRDPCKDIDCPDGTQCGIDLNRNKTSATDADFIAVCREENKPGHCPYANNSSCDTECRTDADCTLHLKCCASDCGTVCVEPQRPSEMVTQPTAPGYTTAPLLDKYYPPRIEVETYEPEVTGLLGDQAILNCAVSGNPNPKIVWSKNNLIIDGTQPRYRIRLDQTLQIITLHKTDAGIYLCTADNSIGSPIQNQINLLVSDTPVERPVSILNGQDPELLVNNIVTAFNSPATLNCYALGWPVPAVTWWKQDELIPLKNREFEVTKDYSLLIHSVQLRNLGVYTCQAYNGMGKAASWSVTVRAKGPYYSTNPRDIRYLQYVVNPPEASTLRVPIESSSVRPDPSSHHVPFYRPTSQPYIPSFYSTEPLPDIVDPNDIFPQIPDAAGYIPESVYSVPVRANITTNEQTHATGTNVQIRCDVYGYPPPEVKWYKDGVPLYSGGKISISDTHTLTIQAAEKSDSGRYQCEAINQYSKASSTLDVIIEGMFIDPSCTDNQFFANCKLIVKANFCNHKYYAKFCCRSCTEAGQLPFNTSKQSALDTNTI